MTDGPWGGSTGYMFDDGVYTGVREVNLSRDYSGIFYMEVVYDRFGHTIQRIKHGGPSYFVRKDKVEMMFLEIYFMLNTEKKREQILVFFFQ